MQMEDKIKVLDDMSTVYMRATYMVKCAKPEEVAELQTAADELKVKIDTLRENMHKEWMLDGKMMLAGISDARRKMESYCTALVQQVNVISNIVEAINIVQQVAIVAASVCI